MPASAAVHTSERKAPAPPSTMSKPEQIASSLIPSPAFNKHIKSG